jgi:hypothetical protein
MEPGGVSEPSRCRVEEWTHSYRENTDGLFLRTHVLEWLKVEACNATDFDCPHNTLWRNILAKEVAPNQTALPGCLQQSYFIAGIDNFSIAFEHTLIGEKQQLNGRQMNGSLVGQDGEELMNLSLPLRDRVPLGLLLEAAGMNGLDDEAEDFNRDIWPCAEYQKSAPTRCCEDFGNSSRARGLHLDVTIEYSNLGRSVEIPYLGDLRKRPFPWLPWTPEYKPTYKIKVRRRAMTEPYFYEEKFGLGNFPVPDIDSNSSKQYKVTSLITGIQISTKSSGVLYHWSFIALVLWLCVVASGDALFQWALDWYIKKFCFDDVKEMLRHLADVIKPKQQTTLAAAAAGQGGDHPPSPPQRKQKKPKKKTT